MEIRSATEIGQAACASTPPWGSSVLGGFVEIAPGVFGNSVPLYTHSLGSGMNPNGVVGGPGGQKPNHACDGKGIDYLDVCFGE